MAHYNKQMLSMLSGIIGSVVLCHYKGKPYVRALPAHYHDAMSPAQLQQRQRMALCTSVVKRFLPILKVGYAAFDSDLSVYNIAMRQLMLQATQGTYPDVQIDYSRVLLGQGPLAVPQNVTLTVVAAQLTVQWSPEVQPGNGSPSDGLLLVVYNRESGGYRFWQQLAQRFEGVAHCQVSAGWRADQLECFIGFKQSVGLVCSNVVHVTIEAGH